VIGFLVANISKSRFLVKIFRTLINRVPAFAAITKALLMSSSPENRWPYNSREKEVFKLLSRAHKETRS
jgi:hypothetical protein